MKRQINNTHVPGVAVLMKLDYCRALVSDSETDQGVTGDAFDLVREIAGKRLKHRKLALIDATNVRPADRKGWIELARQWHALPVGGGEGMVFKPRDRRLGKERPHPTRLEGARPRIPPHHLRP